MVVLRTGWVPQYQWLYAPSGLLPGGALFCCSHDVVNGSSGHIAFRGWEPGVNFLLRARGGMAGAGIVSIRLSKLFL